MFDPRFGPSLHFQKLGFRFTGLFCSQFHLHYETKTQKTIQNSRKIINTRFMFNSFSNWKSYSHTIHLKKNTTLRNVVRNLVCAIILVFLSFVIIVFHHRHFLIRAAITLPPNVMSFYLQQVGNEHRICNRMWQNKL